MCGAALLNVWTLRGDTDQIAGLVDEFDPLLPNELGEWPYLMTVLAGAHLALGRHEQAASTLKTLGRVDRAFRDANFVYAIGEGVRLALEAGVPAVADEMLEGATETFPRPPPSASICRGLPSRRRGVISRSRRPRSGTRPSATAGSSCARLRPSPGSAQPASRPLGATSRAPAKPLGVLGKVSSCCRRRRGSAGARNSNQEVTRRASTRGDRPGAHGCSRRRSGAVAYLPKRPMTTTSVGAEPTISRSIGMITPRTISTASPVGTSSGRKG